MTEHHNRIEAARHARKLFGDRADAAPAAPGNARALIFFPDIEKTERETGHWRHNECWSARWMFLLKVLNSAIRYFRRRLAWGERAMSLWVRMPK